MEHTENMEQTINFLLEQDAAAQKTLRENQLRRQQMADQMTQVKEETQKQKYEEAQKRIDRVRQQNQQEFDREMEALRLSHQKALSELEQNYLSHREEWTRTLLERCLG